MFRSRLVDCSTNTLIPSVQLLALLRADGGAPLDGSLTILWFLPGGGPIRVVYVKYSTMAVNTGLPAWGEGLVPWGWVHTVVPLSGRELG